MHCSQVLVFSFGGLSVGGVGLLVENCIVDESILKIRSNFKKSWFQTLLFDAMVFSICFLIFCGQVFKGTRWMPWHQEPMKDAVICDKPRGADKRASIRGSPNGETPPRVMRGDPHLNS